MQARAVGRVDEQLPDRGKLRLDLGAPRIPGALRIEDQPVLQEVRGQRQADRERDENPEEGRDQVFWYSSAPLRTNSTDFSCMPFST